MENLMTRIFTGWIPNIKGYLSFYADGANQSTERAILASYWNNFSLVGSSSDFRTFSSYERYLDDELLPDLLSINGFIQNKIYRSMVYMGAAAESLRYTSLSKPTLPNQIPFLNIQDDVADWESFGINSAHPYCLEIDLFFFTPNRGFFKKDSIIEKITELQKKFEEHHSSLAQSSISSFYDQKWATFIEDINIESKTHTRGKSFFSAKAVIFPTGLILIPLDYIIQMHSEKKILEIGASPKNINGSIFEIYSFLRDSWHNHKFHRDDDDTLYSFEIIDIENSQFASFKEKIYTSLYQTNQIYTRNMIQSYRPEFLKISEENINELSDLKGQLEYQKTFEKITAQLEKIEPNQIDTCFIDIMEKKITESSKLRKDFWGIAWVVLGILFAGFALLSSDTLFTLDNFISSFKISLEKGIYFSHENTATSDLKQGVSIFFEKNIFNAFDLMFSFLILTGTWIYLYNRYYTMKKTYSLLLYTKDVKNLTYRVFRSLKQATFLPTLFFCKKKNFGILDILSFTFSETYTYIKGSSDRKILKVCKILIVNLLTTVLLTLIGCAWLVFSIINSTITLIMIIAPLRSYFAADCQAIFVFIFLCLARLADQKFLGYIIRIHQKNYIGDQI